MGGLADGLSLAFLVAFVVATIAAPVAGMVLAFRSAKAAGKKDWRRAALLGAAGIPFVLVPTWFWAAIRAELHAAKSAQLCMAALSRRAYPAVLEYRLSHPRGPLPPRWPGTGPEPKCEGAGVPRPYAYLPVPDLNAAASARPPGILVHCPHRHARPWWAPRLFSGCDRVVLDAQGTVRAVSEEGFRQLLGQP